MYLCLKENKLIFECLEEHVYSSQQLEHFVVILSALKPMFELMGAIRCIYICVYVEEAIKDMEFNPKDKLFNLYPALIEFFAEYLQFMDF